MRIVIAALAAAVAGLAVTADAAPSNRKKQRDMAGKQRAFVQRNATRGEVFGYDAMPEHYRTGTNEWWRAMERQGRGGFGDNM